MDGESLSIVIVTYNSTRYIDTCLESLTDAIAAWDGSVECIVVDNASDDDTVSRVLSRPGITLIQNKNNYGYANAANLGLKHASGTWMMVMNPDTRCPPSFITVLMQQVSPYTAHIVSPLILCPDGTVNAAGLKVHYTGVSTCNGLGNPPDSLCLSALASIPVAAPSGAAVIAHQRVWRRLGGFDEDYFLYLEDVDLGIRAQILGYPCVCLPNAQLYHDYQARLTPQKLYYLERSRLLMLRKLYSRQLRRQLTRALVLTTILSGAYAASKGPAHWRAFVRAHRSSAKTKAVRLNPIPLNRPLPTMDRTLPESMGGTPGIIVWVANRLFHQMSKDPSLFQRLSIHERHLS